jgi:hypothetical protein
VFLCAGGVFLSCAMDARVERAMFEERAIERITGDSRSRVRQGGSRRLLLRLREAWRAWVQRHFGRGSASVSTITWRLRGDVHEEGFQPRCSSPILVQNCGDGRLAMGDASLGVGDASLAIGDASLGIGDPSLGIGDASLGVGGASLGVGDASLETGDTSLTASAGRLRDLLRRCRHADVLRRPRSRD